MFFCRIKYELVFFFILVLRMVVITNWSNPIPQSFLSFYLPDFKVGFISRALIGTLVELLSFKITEKSLTIFIVLSYIFTYFLLAVFLAKVLRTIDIEMKNITMFIIVLFLSAPISIEQMVRDIGLQDVYWFLFALLALLCAGNRVAKWLLPFLCFCGLATNYGFIFAYLPLFAVLVLYDLYSNKFSKGSVIYGAVSFIVMIGFSVYFVVFANGTVKMSMDTFSDYITSKVDFTVWVDYFKVYIYNYHTIENQFYNSFFDRIYKIFEYTMSGEGLSYFVLDVLPMFPLLFTFIFIWKTAGKESSKKVEKVFMFICALLPLAFVPAYISSEDNRRFTAHTVIVQFCILLYLILRKNEAVISSLKKAKSFFKKYPELFVFVFFISSYLFNKTVFS